MDFDKIKLTGFDYFFRDKFVLQDQQELGNYGNLVGLLIHGLVYLVSQTSRGGWMHDV